MARVRWWSMFLILCAVGYALAVVMLAFLIWWLG
jgi:hypothetical protein